MDLLLILIYAGICTVIFKLFKIPLNKWSVPTAILGGIAMIGTLLLLMNYNHPYGKYAKEVFISVPVIPAVSGIVVSVDALPNVPLQKGDVLFQIDPKPFQLVVNKLKAKLAEAEQLVVQNKATLTAADARVAKSKADRDRSRKTFERYSKGGKAFSRQQIENRKQLYLAAQATLEAAEAEQLRTKLAFESQIDGIDTRVAQYQAELDTALYNLKRSTVTAPTDGLVAQVALRPGMLASSFPLRPSMVFIPAQQRAVVASFWQNSMLRLEPGAEAEVILDAVPGHVFKGRLSTLLPAMSEAEAQSGGTLISASRVAVHGRSLAIIELDENLDDYKLPLGVQGKVAVYTEHFAHVSMIRRVLLRMMGWLNYAFPMK